MSKSIAKMGRSTRCSFLGDYIVFSWEEVEDGAWYDAEFMKGIESRGTPVHVAEGLTQTARIEVIR